MTRKFAFFAVTLGVLALLAVIVGVLPQLNPNSIGIGQGNEQTQPFKWNITDVRFPIPPLPDQCNKYQESVKNYSDAQIRADKIDREGGFYNFTVFKEGTDLVWISFRRQTTVYGGEQVLNVYIENLTTLTGQGIPTVAMIGLINSIGPELLREMNIYTGIERKTLKILWEEIHDFDWSCLLASRGVDPAKLNKIDVKNPSGKIDEQVPYFEIP